MNSSIITQLIDDVKWIFSLQPRVTSIHLHSVARLLYWHLIRKRISLHHLGEFNGNVFYYDHKSDGSATAFITPQYDYSIQSFISKILDSKSTFIDIGANVGTETLLAAQRGARVHSFEPTPSIFSQLTINVLLNGYENQCTLQEVAVADHTGEARFFVFDDGHQLLNSMVGSKKQKSITVQVITLDSYFKQQALDIAVVKIDVEGAENTVLNGAKKLLKLGSMPVIIWESNMQASSASREETRKLLDSYGYQHFWWNADKLLLEPWNNQENCFSIIGAKLNSYKKLLRN